MTEKCDQATVNFTKDDLMAMATTGETVISARQFGSSPGIGIPKGLRVTCPDCGRAKVLVKPFCGGGTDRSFYYWLRSHSKPGTGGTQVQPPIERNSP